MMNAKDLFTKLQQNPKNHALFSDWYRTEYPAFYFHALRMTSGDRQSAEDYCQDAIVAFVTGGGLEKVRGAGEARAYVHRAIVNRYIDTKRKLAREIPIDSESIPTDTTNPLDTVAAEQLYYILCDALSDDDQAIFAMLIVGESLSDIAEVCGLSYSATGVRVHRIRNIIKELEYFDLLL